MISCSDAPSNTGDANGTVVLNDQNFIGMEKVEVGGTISKDADESTCLQLRDGHYLFARANTVSNQSTASGGMTGNSVNNVVINASGVTKNGLTFDGNGNQFKTSDQGFSLRAAWHRHPGALCVTFA